MEEEQGASIIDAMITKLEKQVKEAEAAAAEQVKKQVIREEILEARAIVEVTKDELEGYRYLKTLKGKKKISMKEAYKAMSITCFKHFAGCCGPEQKCANHLSVCEALGLDPDEVFKVKKDAVDAWLKRLLKTRDNGI